MYNIKYMNDKIKNFHDYFNNLTVLAALSGGTDSIALLHILKKHTNADVTAVTITGAHIPEKEITRAKNFCEKFSVKHKILPVDIHKINGLDDKDRCYFCKKSIFSLLKNMAKNIGANIIVDGSNIDDKNDYRPGMKALKELDVFSPFLHFGWSKNNIFDYLKEQNLDEFISPSNACLISRISYGSDFTDELLREIDKFENFLRSLGFKQVRARIHNDIIRIEIEKERFNIFFEQINLIKKSAEKLNKKFVTLDLNGFRSGSMNPT